MGCPILAIYQVCNGKQVKGTRNLHAVVSYNLAGLWMSGRRPHITAAMEGHKLFSKDKV